ncbi:MAG: helix-turn-helix domain-containing protein [Candidatus Tectomicrobia bacterium]|uniref:Helix-turn-helix domain-containing protein n=1 Tax=Tectimicrobiota bacterium TaxID=2528274 RepID=A0A933GMV7_UNCTE|nr:helix-turn-helix domain-containing protein [Candidatus Tectomicrobia bacterium]
MPFAEKLSKLRKEKGLTQEELAKKIGVGIAQMRRYEKGVSSPTLEVIKNMAKALGVSSDELIFDENEGVANSRILDSKLLEQFELLSRMNPHDKEAVMFILESVILKNRIQQVLPPMSDLAWTREMRKVVSELRRGAKEYSEEEIDQIVDEAVSAVRSVKKAGREKIEA